MLKSEITIVSWCITNPRLISATFSLYIRVQFSERSVSGGWVHSDSVLTAWLVIERG